MLRQLAFFCLVARIEGWGYCNDENDSCANWAKGGECSKAHVKKLCPHSCAACPHTCRDANPSCASWADNGECDNNIDYMFAHCPASCGVCKTKCYVRCRALDAPSEHHQVSSA